MNRKLTWPSLALSAASLVIPGLSLLESRDARRLAETVATSDFQASERVKQDLATLVAVLDSIMMKGVVYSQQNRETRDDDQRPEFVDLEEEFEEIHEVLHGPTAIALRTFVAKRSEAAEREGADSEDWRLFFLYLGELVSKPDPWSAALHAARIELLLSELSEEDINDVARFLSNIPGRIETLWREREHDVVLRVVMEMVAEDVGDTNDTSEDSRMEDAMAFFRYLRDVEQIEDPDVDLFLAVDDTDSAAVSGALDRGGNPNLTIGELVSRYQELHAGFASSRGR